MQPVQLFVQNLKKDCIRGQTCLFWKANEIQHCGFKRAARGGALRVSSVGNGTGPCSHDWVVAWLSNSIPLPVAPTHLV